jgi:hypothetical protein
LITSNDVGAIVDWTSNRVQQRDPHYPGFGVLRGGEPALGAYLISLTHIMTYRNVREIDKRTADVARFAADLEAIAAHDHIQIVHFDDVAVQVPTRTIAKYQTTVSTADGHPDAESHDWVAEQLQDIVTETKPPEC